MANLEYGQAPVLDIITFGYRKAFQNFVAILKLAILPALIVAIVAVFRMSSYEDLHSAGNPSNFNAIFNYYFKHGPLLLLGTIAFCLAFAYSSYSTLILAKRSLNNEFPLSNNAFLLISSNYIGLLGIGVIGVIGGIIACILISIGTVLLILPGLIALAASIFFAIRFTMTSVVYVNNPEIGIFGAFKKSWELVKNNFWRTFLLLFMVGIINFVLQIPFSIIGGIIAMYNTLMTEYGHGNAFILTAHFFVIFFNYFVTSVIGLGGISFVTMRYYFDLNEQYLPKEVVPIGEIDLPGVPKNYWN